MNTYFRCSVCYKIPVVKTGEQRKGRMFTDGVGFCKTKVCVDKPFVDDMYKDHQLLKAHMKCSIHLKVCFLMINKYNIYDT